MRRPFTKRAGIAIRPPGWTSLVSKAKTQGSATSTEVSRVLGFRVVRWAGCPHLALRDRARSMVMTGGEAHDYSRARRFQVSQAAGTDNVENDSPVRSGLWVQPRARAVSRHQTKLTGGASLSAKPGIRGRG